MIIIQTVNEKRGDGRVWHRGSVVKSVGVYRGDTPLEVRRGAPE